METIFVTLLDEFSSILRKNTRRQFILRVILCLCFYLMSLSMVTEGGFYLFTIIDEALGGFPLLVCAFGEIFVLQHVYG